MVKFTPTHRVDRQIALLLLAFTAGIYLRTLAPGLLGGDSGEFQFAAWRLGLAHPTGYPLYLMVGSAWQHTLALVGVSPATAMNALSALFGAFAVALLYCVMNDWLHGPAPVRRAAALLTATLFAVNPTFWSQNLIAEVYTLHVLLILLIFRSVQMYAPSVPSRTTDSPAAGSQHPAQLTPLLTFFFVGLALAHHGMTLFLAPGLLIGLWLLGGPWWRSPRQLFTAALATSAPLAFYLYIPLRSGPAASPWYHQSLGAAPLDLYQNNWSSLINFMTGRSISVGFHRLDQAVAQLAQAGLLWRLHFNWPGLVLLGLGLYVLVQQRRWSVLALTLTYAIIQQLFNLFYAIDDILVYYIPLYLMGTIWVGFAANAVGNGMRSTGRPGVRDAETESGLEAQSIAADKTQATSPGIYLVLILFLLPAQLLTTYSSQLDQSNELGVRRTWEAILAAQPPSNAILISNDRDEIVPLFYLQTVEKRAVGLTGLFPLIDPTPRFADIGATVETALAQSNGRPVYLIKPMPGLAVKFALAPATPPLVRVTGQAVQGAPTDSVDQAFGPLHLLGYDWQIINKKIQLDLHWVVQATVPGDYTTTVQLFDAKGEKIAQDDSPPGGVYYPTRLWKPGEKLIDRHTLALPTSGQPVSLLVGMYIGADFKPLAPALKLAWQP